MAGFLRKYYLIGIIVIIVVAWAGFTQYQLMAVRNTVSEIEDSLQVPARAPRTLEYILGNSRTIGGEIARIKNTLGDMQGQMQDIEGEVQNVQWILGH
jgi:hypothetical protein